MADLSAADLREEVRSRYAEAARAVLEPSARAQASCCGTGSAALDPADCFGGQLYGEGETDGLPEKAVLASLGCGNPLAVADLRDGERRIGISDVVAEDHLTPADRAAAGSYVGCIAGALSRAEYLAGLAAVGFAEASVTFTHEAAPGMHSAIIRAVRPLTG
jgi:hypothetical protein